VYDRCAVTELWKTSTVISLGIVQPSNADMFLKMVLHVQSDQRIASSYHASNFRGVEKKKGTLRHMHGYHETLINCGASPPGSRLLCILRAGSRKTTCLSVLANFKMIYRPRETKFFAVLCGFSAVPKGTADAFDMQLWSLWARSVKLTLLIDCYFISSPSSRLTLKYVSFKSFDVGFFGRHVSRWPAYVIIAGKLSAGFYVTAFNTYGRTYIVTRIIMHTESHVVHQSFRNFVKL